MPTSLPSHRLVAFNTATASENKIHDDEVASRFGFSGGLVPGVDVYAYLCRPVLERWGAEFVTSGKASTRFGQPVFDGEEVTVEAELDGEVIRATVLTDGPRASLTATLAEDTLVPAAGATAPLPDPADRPPASEASLVAGSSLGSYRTVCDEDEHAGYLDDIRDHGSPLLAVGVVHPGWLLRQANRILSRNVVLGPWIHVGSEITHHRPVTVGEPISVRADVDRTFEHKGHAFVTLDVTIVGSDESVRCAVAHTAIYEPRQVRSATP